MYFRKDKEDKIRKRKDKNKIRKYFLEIKKRFSGEKIIGTCPGVPPANLSLRELLQPHVLVIIIIKQRKMIKMIIKGR